MSRPPESVGLSVPAVGWTVTLWWRRRFRLRLVISSQLLAVAARLQVLRVCRHLPSRDRQGVPYGPRRATKENEDANCRSNGINGLDRVFNGAVAAERISQDRLSTREHRPYSALVPNMVF